MSLSPHDLDLIVNTLSNKFLEETLLIRQEIIETMGKLGSEKAIPFLCEILKTEKDYSLLCAIMEAMINIKNHRRDFPMSDSQPKYIFNSPQNVQINEQGDGNIHNYAPSQNLVDAAKEIQ